MPRIAIPGAGIIGLTMALQILRALPRACVTVIADQFLTDTTSDGAAGIFRPNPVGLGSHVDRNLIERWARDSMTHYSNLAMSRESKAAGVSFISGYHLFSSKPDPVYSSLSQVLPAFREMTQKELGLFPQPYPIGYAFTSVIAEPRFYMPYLMESVKELGGIFETRKIENIEDLVDQFDLVVNCAGLRSKELVGDTKVYPVKGQMLRLHTPWLKHFVYVDQDTWIIPGRESTTVGGTRERDVSDCQIVQPDVDAIMERAAKVVPSIKEADVLWTWAGLRPARDPIRVELETRMVGDKQLKIVHNYGHGGHGIGLSWGTCKHATSLVLDALASEPSSKL